MGQYWPLAMGAVMWGVFICAWVRHKWMKNLSACPQCEHESGLDDTGKRCGTVEDFSGWVTDRCKCQNDYHWNYDSVGI